MTHTLTFDLGTTFFKAAVFVADGGLLALARRENPAASPHPGWFEFPAATFRDAITQLTDELRSAAPDAYANIDRLCFSTQANTFLLLGGNDDPLTPLIAWNDRRAADVAIPDFNDYARTGVPALGPGFMPAKLLWLKQHRPEAWAAARRLCLLSDYFTLWLTGKHITEAGVAGLSGMVDIHDLVWRSNAITALGIEHLTLPTIKPAGTDLGTLTEPAATELHLSPDCRFVTGTLDQYAGAVAAGLLDEPGVCETTGTVLATVRTADAFDPTLRAAGVFQGPSSVPGRYFRMRFGDTSANLVTQYRDTQPDRPGYEQLDAEATANDTARGRAVRAIYQQVADALATQAYTLCPDGLPDRIVSLGGGARSACWRDLKAARLGITIDTLPLEEPTCFGAYRLAHRSLHPAPGNPEH